MTEHTHHSVPFSVTLICAAILVAMALSLALEEKIHAKKSLITGVFAAISLFVGSYFHLLPFGPLLNVFGEEMAVPVFIAAVDWGVITIIFGSSLFIDVTAKSGLFTWIAIKLTKASRGDPLILLSYYGVMTVVFSAVLNNVTAMIIVGALSAVSLAKLKRSHKLLGFLLVEGLLTNIGGLLTLISSVPNIIVGTAAGISFVEFFIKAAPYVVVATALTIVMGAKTFGIQRLASDQEREEATALVAGFDENDGIVSQAFFVGSCIMTCLFIVCIATASVLPVVAPLGMGFVAMAFAAVMLVRFKHEVDQFYKALDWDLLLFFVFLFVVINVMEHAQVLALIGQGLAQLIALGPQLGVASTLVSSALFSAVTDNIPLAAMLARILEGLGTHGESGLWWAVIFGANLGGNITPIGSASTVVAVTIMHKHKLDMSFIAFVKAAVPFAAIQIVLATLHVVYILPHLG